MSQPDIDILTTAITLLNERYSELKDVALLLPPSKKLDLLDQLDLLNVRITRMESVLNHIEAEAVVIQPPSAEDKETLKEALGALGEQVEKDMQWAAAVKLTKSFLDAVRTISDNVTVRTVA
jgi:hypothetical protein